MAPKEIVVVKDEDQYAYEKAVAWLMRNGLQIDSFIDKALKCYEDETCSVFLHVYDKGYTRDMGRLHIRKDKDRMTVIFAPSELYRELNPSFWRRIWNSFRGTR